MQPRFNVSQLAPKLYRAVAQLGGAVKKSGLDSRLLVIFHGMRTPVEG